MQRQPDAFASDPTLCASLKSMLTLSADVGLMAERIREMGDQILLMSDNIGLQADQILVTQQAMNADVAATQTSVGGADADSEHDRCSQLVTREGCQE